NLEPELQAWPRSRELDELSLAAGDAELLRPGARELEAGLALLEPEASGSARKPRPLVEVGQLHALELGADLGLAAGDPHARAPAHARDERRVEPVADGSRDGDVGDPVLEPGKLDLVAS